MAFKVEGVPFKRLSGFDRPTGERGMITIRMRSFIRKLRQSKGTYVGLYFLAIPFFAGLYTLITPQDFLHTNIEHEKGFKKDKHESLRAIRMGLDTYLKGKPLNTMDLKYTIDSVENLSYSNEEFSFRVYLHKVNDAPSKPVKPKNCEKFRVQAKRETDSFMKKMMDYQYHQCTRIHYDFTFLNCQASPFLRVPEEWDRVGEAPGAVDEEDQEVFEIDLSESHEKNEKVDLPLRLDSYYIECFKHRSSEHFVSDFQEEVLLQTSEKQIKGLMRNHEQLVNGQQLAATWALFWRMFYFSAVTITTLGYGDIVPISDLARLLVAAESILGIILIGLFFNALTRKEEI